MSTELVVRHKKAAEGQKPAHTADDDGAAVGEVELGVAGHHLNGGNAETEEENRGCEDLLLDTNPFHVYMPPRESVNKSWHAVATVAFMVSAVLGVFGLIYIHMGTEHYNFHCVSADSIGENDADYHIGMCECTSTGTFEVAFDSTGAYSGCNQGTWSLPKCLEENSVEWLQPDTIGYAFQGVNIKNDGHSSAGCFGAEYTCYYGTCYPLGSYYAYQTYSLSGGSSSSDPVDLNTARGVEVLREFDGLTPSVKCCGFVEQSKVGQALSLMGSIGGLVSTLTAFYAVVFARCMQNHVHPNKDKEGEPE